MFLLRYDPKNEVLNKLFWPITVKSSYWWHNKNVSYEYFDVQGINISMFLVLHATYDYNDPSVQFDLFPA